MMLAVGLITGQLTAHLRYQAQVAAEREARSRALFELTRELSGALQTEQVRTHIALAGASELSFQSGAEPTDFTDPVVHSVIDEFARQRLPAAVLAAFMKHFGEADVDQGIIPEGDVAAYYGALFELLVEYADVPQAALSSLARYRAQAVVDGLERQGVDRPRVQVATEPQAVEAGLEGVPLPLGLQTAPALEDSTSKPGVESWE